MSAPPQYPHRPVGNAPEFVWPGKGEHSSEAVYRLRCAEQVGSADAKGWINRFIEGDNRTVLSALLNGPLRGQLERHGGIKLIYIDPPFDVGADFKNEIPIGEGTQNLSEFAYCDRWGEGSESIFSMLYERLRLMRELLAPDGTIYVHCDYRMNAPLRLMMDELFGAERFLNHIIWSYKTGGIPSKVGFSKKHDDILVYTRGERPIFNQLFQRSYVPTLPEPHTESGARLGVRRDDVCELCAHGTPGQKYRHVVMRDVWDDIPSLFRNDPQRTGYATQKPEGLLARIISASSNPGDIVADFFAGSGTTLAVASRLGRRWIGCDCGDAAIHTVRKRLVAQHRSAQGVGFEILTIEPEVKVLTALEPPRAAVTVKVAVSPILSGEHLSVKLTGIEVQDVPLGGLADSAAHARLAIEGGRLIRIAHGAAREQVREVLTESWADWIDYWAVDTEVNQDGVFRNAWEAFRTRQQRTLSLCSEALPLAPGCHRVAVRIVDILGVTTTDLIEVHVPQPSPS